MLAACSCSLPRKSMASARVATRPALRLGPLTARPADAHGKGRHLVAVVTEQEIRSPSLACHRVGMGTGKAPPLAGSWRRSRVSLMTCGSRGVGRASGKGRLDKVGAARLPFRVIGRHHAQHHPGLVQQIARQHPLQIGRCHPGDALEVAVLEVGVSKQGVAGGQLLHLASHAVQRPDPQGPLGIDRVGQLLAGDALAGELADDPVDLRLDGAQFAPLARLGTASITSMQASTPHSCLAVTETSRPLCCSCRCNRPLAEPPADPPADRGPRSRARGRRRSDRPAPAWAR